MSQSEKFRKLVIVTAITNLVWKDNRNWKEVLQALIEKKYRDIEEESLQCVIDQLTIDSKDTNFLTIEDQQRSKEQPRRREACIELINCLSNLRT